MPRIPIFLGISSFIDLVQILLLVSVMSFFLGQGLVCYCYCIVFVTVSSDSLSFLG